MTDVDLVRELEQLMARAWPPLRTQVVGGWVLRASGGVSRRANSVWPRDPVGDLTAAVCAAEAFYDEAGLPPTFQLSPAVQPGGLPALLDAHGYGASGPTDVCVADLSDVAAADRGRPQQVVVVRDRPDKAWFSVGGAVLHSAAAAADGSHALLDGVRLPCGYALATVDGAPAACGRAVLDGDWVGIYSMATLPFARGRGAARAILAALGRWASAGGASRAYLQVEDVSEAARALYFSAGFTPTYQYVYRRRPAA